MPWSGQDGVRVERRWSEGGANIKQGFNGGWRRLQKLDTKKRRIFIQIGCVLHRLEFVTPFLFHFSTVASLHSLCFCSKKSVGAEKAERSEKRWKNEED